MTEANKLFSDEQKAKLIANGVASAAHPDGSIDAPPVVKWFLPEGAATWLISEIDADNPDLAFGLCDLGFGSPELGSVSMSELLLIRTPRLKLPVERDLYIDLPQQPLSVYATRAREAGCIVTEV